MTAYFAAHKLTVGILIGVIFGVAARLMMLKTDYRQYPTYPHGRIIHISLGVIAAALGAIAVPALFNKDYTAITFLTLAAQQFRDVRKMERETLTKIDELELVPRGATYIEGIAMVFEGRNYLVIMAAFLASLGSILLGWYWGAAAGLLSLWAVRALKSGKSVSHIAKVETAAVRQDGPDLYVGDIYMMNVGLASNRETISERGLGLILSPFNANGKATLGNLGQRQAILFDLSTLLGVYRDDGEPALVPLAKLDMRDGRLGIFLLPQDKDPGKARAVTERVPVLESAVRMPTEAKVNRKEKGANG
ncbi:membrane protein [Paenibacillus darwinianus]|uniref:Membrane protein n=1 Tax=Paenibacillus darwinianus TaxID=1380763 RepID=A0A9W5W8T1_9BACL|nr:YIEGIA family protein [Paenibacillus darwinianus]EXX91396.1 membrane protein [Paenibacillus darwinianus]EXX92228.1 membrane protein [Paenibacillus darwinianus]EXX92331.1 membrane protein [Paenibacillus darwinianus]